MTSTPDIRIVPLREPEIPALIALARAIWHDHYPSIVGIAQIEYMLDQRYRAEMIRAQLGRDDVWWDALHVDDALAGFVACERGEAAGEIKLDKLYVASHLQGRGLGTRLLRHAEQRAVSLGAHRIYLQVNRNNLSAIATYRRNGYAVAAETVFDIGNGFVMDDYVMARSLAPDCGR